MEQFTHCLDMVGSEVIHCHHITWAERRNQNIFIAFAIFPKFSCDSTRLRPLSPTRKSTLPVLAFCSASRYTVDTDTPYADAIPLNSGLRYAASSSPRYYSTTSLILLLFRRIALKVWTGLREQLKRPRPPKRPAGGLSRPSMPSESLQRLLPGVRQKPAQRSSMPQSGPLGHWPPLKITTEEETVDHPASGSTPAWSETVWQVN